MKPVATAELVDCKCGCGHTLWDRDKSYRKKMYIKNHDKRKPIKKVFCECGCGQSMPERLDNSYRKKTFIPGHQHRLRRIKPNKIKCACGCGQIIDDIRRKKDGKPYRVKMAKGHMYKGKDNHFWQGGKTTEARRIKQSHEYREWRRQVFDRDNYTCQGCGIKNTKGLGKTVELHPDHIKPQSLYPELRFDLNNGRTLCAPCHRKTDTYGIKLVHSSRQRL